ncbi:hypothetical protein [Sabulicella rubraurantiaca]|uniref:hypothetical protein n=1 Tax=Sabulicella rubraurantiaca TaxID=2811429 RepID=UPI001A97441D|nr:hypothetical protein [Sabulicella rubraurantiaca]
MILRLVMALLLALGGLFLAARAHFEVTAEQVGLLVVLLAVIWAYRIVAAHFDRADHE